MATELRDYRIVEGSLDQWVEEWRTRIAPIRRELGFTVERAWKVEDEGRFVWLLTYPGDWQAFEAADRAYYDSPQRKGLDPNPARLIGKQSVAKLTEIEL
ncbi:MAG: NIPSNAP family protein [Chloroflexi bacterium]|nr:NIPSNAP family protein [Chloroflexota bacterium]